MGSGTEDGSPIGAEGSRFRPHSDIATDMEDAGTKAGFVDSAVREWVEPASSLVLELKAISAPKLKTMKGLR